MCVRVGGETDAPDEILGRDARSLHGGAKQRRAGDEDAPCSAQHGQADREAAADESKENRVDVGQHITIVGVGNRACLLGQNACHSCQKRGLRASGATNRALGPCSVLVPDTAPFFLCAFWQNVPAAEPNAAAVAVARVCARSLNSRAGAGSGSKWALVSNARLRGAAQRRGAPCWQWPRKTRARLAQITVTVSNAVSSRGLLLFRCKSSRCLGAPRERVGRRQPCRKCCCFAWRQARVGCFPRAATSADGRHWESRRWHAAPCHPTQPRRAAPLLG